MRKNGYYKAYDYDYLEEGEKLKLEHEVKYQLNDKILLPLVNASYYDLIELRNIAVTGEQKLL